MIALLQILSMGNSLQKPIENRQSPRQEKENPRQEEIKEEELEDIDGTFTCDICIEPMSVNNKFKNNNLCTHPFCQDCTAKYIEVKVRDNNTAKVECPGLHCEQFLDPFACKPTIPSSLFLKWCDHLCEDYVLGFERSYCPNRNCMAVMVNECEGIGRVKKAQCPKCKQWFCFQCKLAWHAGYRCEESGNLRDRNDIAFGKLLEKMNWTRCPGCGNCIERKKGCRIMFCRCKTRFCYECGGNLKSPSGCLCKEKGDVYCHHYCAIICGLILIFTVLGVLGGVIYGIYCVIKRVLY